MYKVYIKGNYLFIEDSVTQDINKMNIRKNVYIERDGTIFNFYREARDFLIITLSFSDIVKEDGTPYASIDDFVNFIVYKTGSNNNYTNGAIDVILQDPTTPILIAPLSNVQYETTLTAIFTRGIYDITVADPTGFSTLDFVTIYNTVEDRVFFAHPISVLGNVVTLSIQSDFDFPIGSPVTLGTTNMNVDGSVTPKIFGVRNPGTEDIPLKFDVSRIMIKILADSSITLEKFGDIAGGILRGVLIRRVDGSWQNLFHWTTNAELKNLCFDLDIQTAVGNQQDGLTARFTFGGQGKLGTVIRIGPNEDLQIIIQDDLTSLGSFRIIAEGSVVSDD